MSKLENEDNYSLKKIGGNDMGNNTPIYDYEVAIKFIAERGNIDKDIIENVLMLEEDYMRSIGIICDDELDIE